MMYELLLCISSKRGSTAILGRQIAGNASGAPKYPELQLIRGSVGMSVAKLVTSPYVRVHGLG